MRSLPDDGEVARCCFEIGPLDLKALALVGHLLLPDERDRIAEEVSDLIMSWPETQRMVDEKTLRQIRAAALSDLDHLLSGDLSPSSLACRRRLAAHHAEQGIAPRWHMACYAFYMCSLLGPVTRRLSQISPELLLPVVRSLLKTVLFDVALCWDEYLRSKEQRMIE